MIIIQSRKRSRGSACQSLRPSHDPRESEHHASRGIVREAGEEGIWIIIYISNPIKNLTSFTGTRQIVAIGRNYADHVKELRNSIPKEPFFFLKPTTSYLVSGGTVEIPRGIIAHHEGTL